MIGMLILPLSQHRWTKIKDWLDRLDRTIATWMNRHGRRVLRYTLGIVFIWFGLLKPLGMSPVADLIASTVYIISPQLFVPILGWWEVAIGICLLFRPLIRLGILLLFLQIPGTFLPLVIVPSATWVSFPYAPTIEGQFILKNLVIIGAALVVGGTVREEDDIPGPLRPMVDKF